MPCSSGIATSHQTELAASFLQIYFALSMAFTSLPFLSFFAFKARILSFLPIIHQGLMPTSTLTTSSGWAGDVIPANPFYGIPRNGVFVQPGAKLAMGWPLAMASISTRVNFLPIYVSHKAYPYI